MVEVAGEVEEGCVYNFRRERRQMPSAGQSICQLPARQFSYWLADSFLLYFMFFISIFASFSFRILMDIASYFFANQFRLCCKWQQWQRLLMWSKGTGGEGKKLAVLARNEMAAWDKYGADVYVKVSQWQRCVWHYVWSKYKIINWRCRCLCVCVLVFVLGALECKGKQTQLPTNTHSFTPTPTAWGNAMPKQN